MQESVLDDCPGMSPRRKKILLETFGSVASLRRATPEAIAAIPGISLKAAETITQWLNS